jgi:beta-lactamase regulating signal transducer with metallopeptidase domain
MERASVMSAWFETGISNGVAATGLALVAWLVTRFCRRPRVAFALWLLVLLKLVAPPLVELPVASLRSLAILEHPPVEQARPAEWPPLVVPEPAPLPADLDGEVRTPADEPVVLDALPDDVTAIDSRPSDGLADEIGFDVPPTAARAPVEAGHPHEAAAAQPAIERFSSADVVRGLGWLWLTGSLSWFVVAALRMMRFARSLRRAMPASGALQQEVAALAARLGLSRAPWVRLTQRRIPPLVWTMGGRATLLLPSQLTDGLSHEQHATLIAHELVHLERRDYLVRWLELAALGWYWWHPVAWWARRNLSAAQEQCCDARVLSLFPKSARAYAETLLATVEFLAEPSRPLPAGASGFSEFGHLHRRLTMILQSNKAQRLAWPLRAALAALAIAVLPVSLHTLWADPAAPNAEETVARKAEPAADSSAIEQRLERLEKMIEKVVPKEAAPSTPAAPPSPARDPRFDVKAAKAAEKEAEKQASQATNIFNSETLSSLQKQSDQLIDETWRGLSRRMHNAEGAHAAVLATARQVEAVRKAYDSGTITADQVLEALRRQFNNQQIYAKYVGELANDSSQPYMTAVAELVAAERTRREIKKFWEDLADRGAPKSEIEQATQQHRMFEQIVGQYSRALHEAMKRRVDSSNYKGAEWSLGAQATIPIAARKAPADARAHELWQQQIANRRKLEAMQKGIEQKFTEIQKEEKVAMAALESAQHQAQERLARMQALRQSLAQDTEKLNALRKITEEEIQRIPSLLEAGQRATREEERKRAVSELYKAGLPMPSDDKTKGDPADKQPAEPAKAEPGKHNSGSLFPKSGNVLLSSDELLEEARRTWQAAHKKYQNSPGKVEAAEEAQAREHYFRVKALVPKSLYYFIGFAR